jgi:ribosome-associated protein
LLSEIKDDPRTMTARAKALWIARLAVDFKALDLVVLDVSGLSSFADFFVICSGKSSRQAQGISDNILESLGKEKVKPLGVEGHREGQWVLMDYEDVIVHIFYEPVRLLYDLESLWSEAERVRGDHEDKPESTIMT